MRTMLAGVKFSAALTLILVLGFAQTAAAQSANGPLNFGNNFFVTGDYVVAGAQGLNVTFNNDGTTPGTITIPDGNPGIQPGSSSTCIINGKIKKNCVPAGADIVAAFLYWQTVEKLGQPGSGKNGFFRGYAITGVAVNSHNTVSFSSGGCTGGSTGKIIETYRADVRGYLPQDASGNILANSAYQVRLPSVGPSTPLTLGATLVIIYRVLAPNFPLNSIVIYEGGFSNSSSPSLTMKQTVQGFYDAAHDPLLRVSRLTHIVGGGKNYKFQNVYLNDLNTPLPPLYVSGQPFPGYYGGSAGYGWDNTTWTFPDQNGHNPVNADDASATTKVVPTTSNQGCVSWGAVIFSTTVQNSDVDGILDVWKVPAAPHSLTPGYCDASANEGQCSGPGDPAWVDLPGAVLGTPGNPHKDVFLQLDYMCSRPSGADSCTTGNGTDYSFDPRLTGADVMMTSAFSDNGHGILLHINPVNMMGTTQPIHAIQEQTCADGSMNPICASVATNGLTPFPGQPGVVGWKAGFEFLKNQPVNYPDETSCEQALNGPCIRRFQYGRKDSYHYAVFAHAIGRPTWGLQGGSLASVVALHNTVTFTTAAPHGLVVDSHLGNGRVTIADAITNPNLNGTYLVQSVSPPAGVFAITQTSMAAGIATYTFGGNPPPLAGDLVTVTNTTNGNAVFNVGNATIAAVDPVLKTFTVDFHVNGFLPSPIAAQSEMGGCAPAAPTGACAHTNRPPFFFTVNITTPVSPQTAYTELTDPNLTVTPGQASTGSGFSDIGGADTLVTLGLWGNPAFNGSSPATSPVSDGQKETVQAGTFMHELGHTLGLTHGGLFFDNLAPNHPDYTPTLDANCKSNYQSVMNYMFQSDLLGPNSDVLDFSSQQLDPLHETGLLPIALNGFAPAVKFSTTTWYDLTPNFRIDPFTHLPVQVGSKAKHHCDGSPMFFNADVPPFIADFTPIMYPHLNQALPSWSANSLDTNFDGMIDTGPHGYRGYNDWANIDLRQIGATGSDISGAGHLGGGPGHLGGGPGHLGGGPGHLGGGPGHLGGGPGVEIDFETANAVTRPPRNLMVTSEDGSPRFIHLSWTAPTFGQIGAYRIYRSADGGLTFALLATVPGSQLTYIDMTDTCIQPKRFEYYVTAVLAGTFAAFPPGPTEGQESEPSNTVSTGSDGLLTGCYVVSNFSSPASAVQGSQVQVTWTLTDDFNTIGNPVTRGAANTIVAIGPGTLQNGCTTGRTTLLADGVPTNAADMFNNSGDQFTFTWNNTDAFCAGSYAFELDLDHVNSSPAQVQPDPTQLQLAIDVNDTDSTPHVATVALSAGTVGLAYSNTLTQHGGTAPFTWTFTGSLPNGITQQAQNSPTLSGTTCVAGSYNFTAMVTDSKSNSGTQPLTLQINKANTTTGVISNANPSVFQQMVTFSVTVTPNSPCIPTGTVTLSDGGTPIASNLALSSGTATFTTSALSVGVHNITASYGGDSNFNGSNSNSAPLSQTVNKANTSTTITLVSPSPAVVGQAITVAYNLAVVAPGAGTPIGPSGTITVMASDGSSCVAAAALGPGACVLTPAPTTAGNMTVTVTYSGDSNFVGSVSNVVNYTVLIFVSDTAPPPFTAVKTLPNGVVGSPYSNTVYESGGVTTGPNNFSWTIVPNSVMPGAGSTLPGLSFQPNAVGVLNGALSGTPTSAGTFTFTAMVTDSVGNTGTQNLTITVLAPAPVPYGLVSWYPFEGNANDLEKLNNGNVVGTPRFVPGEVDNGLKPGPQLSGSLITVPDSPTLALPQFTIGAWVRVDNLDNVETMQIVWKGDMTAGDLTTPYSLSVLGSAPSNFNAGATVVGTAGPGKVLVLLTDGTHELDLVSTNALPLDGKFHYVAVTADGQKVNLYVDGVLDGNSPASESSLTGLPFTSTNPLQIGGIQGGPAPGNNFDGVIDELQVWNRVLTAAEVSGIFNTVGEYQPAARPAGLVSWWPAEGNYTDIISGNNGAPSGGVGFAPGAVGQAFSFSGGAAEIQVADNANLDVGQITIEAWVKPTTSGHGRPIVQKRSSANVGGYTFETTDTSDGPGPANGLQFAIWISGKQSLLQTPANVLTIGAWQHVAATFDGSTMKIYVNGALQASQAVSGTIDSDADPLVMGLNVTNASYDWNGFTDEVSLYNRALTSTEIQSIFNTGGAGKEKP